MDNLEIRFIENVEIQDLIVNFDNETQMFIIEQKFDIKGEYTTTIVYGTVKVPLKEISEVYIEYATGDATAIRTFMEGLKDELWLAVWDELKAHMDKLMERYAVHYDKIKVSDGIDKIYDRITNGELTNKIAESLKNYNN